MILTILRIRPVVFSAALLVGLGGSVANTVASDDSRAVEARAESLVQQYCVECHGPDVQEADIDLTLAGRGVFQHRRTWERVREVLLSHQMPPAEEQQPNDAERALLADWIDDSLNNADWHALRHPGRVPLARLTRAEYEWTVRDLFGVAVDLSGVLAIDPEGLSGFANDRTSMTMSAAQLERTFDAAAVVADAVLDAPLPAENYRYEVETGENASYGKKVSEDDDGVRGWTFSPALGQKYQSVRRAIDFPKTGSYRVRVRARSTGPGPAAGMWIAIDSVNDASQEPGVLVEGEQFDEYETEVFITAGRHDVLFGYDFYRPQWLPAVPSRPSMKLGQSTFDPPPYDQQSLLPDGVSREELTEEGFAIDSESEPRVAELIDIINNGYYPAVLDRLMLNKFHYSKGYLPVFIGGLSYEYTNTVVPAFEELAQLLKTDRKRLEKLWEGHETPIFDELEEIFEKQRAAWSEQDQSRKAAVGGLMVDWIEFEPVTVEPPFRIPVDEDAVSDFLDQLLPRALRRPVSERERGRYLSVYRGERQAGAAHRDAVRRMLIGVLVSPAFLYRSEGNATADVEPLDGHALASRLSYFIWSSTPDAELQELARNDELQSEPVLEQQVDRMLDDARSARFARQFTEQWLDLAGIGREKEPDKELFRYFSWHLADDMRLEVALLLQRVLQEDRSVLELLDDDETFLNERLARLYGIDGVRGGEMRVVELSDQTRGGLLGAAAVLTSTSLATRTSPVRRGQFLLETLLGVELPPPPPGVPALADDAGQSETLSLRDSLAAHRADPNCAGCHSKIDPLGFALENFDWIGRWRSEDPAGPVDSRGQLPDGTTLDGLPALKAYLVQHRKDDFLRALTESMLAYSLGRELEYYDEHAIQTVVAAVKNDRYSARTLVKEIAKSYPFRYRADTIPTLREP